MRKLVQIYFKTFNKITIITGTNFLAFFLLLFVSFTLLDSDPGGKVNADPDPQATALVITLSLSSV